MLFPAAISVGICAYFANLLHVLHHTTDVTLKADLIRELSFGIAVLLFFTVMVNWGIIVYVKDLKYKYTQACLRGSASCDRKR